MIPKVAAAFRGMPQDKRRRAKEIKSWKTKGFTNLKLVKSGTKYFNLKGMNRLAKIITK